MQIIKIYYNQSCSICNCEINYYKKKIKNPLFEWVNINDNIKAYIETKKTKDQLMRRMHALVHGHLVVGAKAFLIIWEEINYLRVLAKTFSLYSMSNLNKLKCSVHLAYKP
jgi:predicted DCC family thiol-disulfide oxidoreductase YuxK